MKTKRLYGPVATVVASSLFLAIAAGANATEHSSPRAADVPEAAQDSPRPEDQNTPWTGTSPEPAPADERVKERTADQPDASRPAAGDRRSVGEFVDDAVVTTRVKFALLQDDQLKGLEIKVKTLEGVVNLSGEVASEAERKLAAEVAAGVDGVRDVQHEGLVVK